MEAQVFSKWNTPLQVAGLKSSTAETLAANAPSTAFAADKIVEVQDVDGLGAWFEIVTGAVVPAADSGIFVPPYGNTGPFVLPAGYMVEATAKINFRTRDREDA